MGGKGDKMGMSEWCDRYRYRVSGSRSRKRDEIERYGEFVCPTDKSGAEETAD